MTEHDKLHAISDKSQACGAFYDWLHEKGWVLCEFHLHTNCERDKDGFGWDCGISKGSYVPIMPEIRKLLAEFFEIDEAKLEAEKRAMLIKLRSR